MVRALWAEVIRDSFGNPIAGARVEVRDPGGSGPTGTPLYVSWAGAERWAQPLVANGQGFVWFYTAAPGAFDLWVTAAGYSPRLVAGVQTAVSGALDPGLVPVLGPSGPGHGAGLVPDPGAVAGTGRFLREDGQWAGAVQRVELAAPGEFTVSGSPVTGSGTLTLGKGMVPAHAVLAGPASGGPGAWGARALVLGDLPGVPLARVYASGPQVLADGVWTTLGFDGAWVDTDGLHGAGAPERLVCQTAGTYLVGAVVKFAVHGAGIRGVALAQNGAVTVADMVVGAVGGGYTRVFVAGLVALGVGEYVVCRAYQNSGGPLEVLGADHTSFWAVRLAG